MLSDPLVSVGLPVRNGVQRLDRVIGSILGQDYKHLQLVICDNASTDGTEEYCRRLAASNDRVLYHRQAENVGILGNFVTAAQVAEGTFFRWISDDDWIEPNCVSRAVEKFAEDDRLVLVASKIAYTGPDGVTQTSEYTGTGLGSDDPVERFTEMLRMLNRSHLMIDPLYGLIRRDDLVTISRRNMLREDEVFATKLALAGPWGYVPEVLGHRGWKPERMPVVARRLDVPGWQAHFATTLQCKEMLGWLRKTDLSPAQRRRARSAVYRMYLHRQAITTRNRGRKVILLARRR